VKGFEHTRFPGGDELIPTPASEAAPAVAFFDLDGTLVSGQTTFLLIKFLRRAGVVSRTFLVGTGLWFLAYKARLVRVSEGSRSKSASVLKGLEISEVEALMKRFSEEEMVPRLHRGASAALSQHLAAGDRVVVLSAALDPVVRALCERLQVPEYVGASCEVEGGAYTGRLYGIVPYGEEKARVAAKFMDRWGADPSGCWAYADHETDIALLRSVGHPVAVSPKPALLEVAKGAGWPIL
jgi:HAD superfamily hydrolase (TIGR01490 family)